jgi:hypothetical protein
MLALAVPIFGVVAPYAYLAEGAQRTLALGAMTSSIVGISLMLSRMGDFAWASSPGGLRLRRPRPQPFVLGR